MPSLARVLRDAINEDPLDGRVEDISPPGRPRVGLSLVPALPPPDPDQAGPHTLLLRALCDELMAENQALDGATDLGARTVVRLNRDMQRFLASAEAIARIKDAVPVLDARLLERARREPAPPPDLRVVRPERAAAHPPPPAPEFRPLGGRRRHP